MRVPNPNFQLDIGWQALFKDLGVSAQDVLHYAHLPLDLLSRKSPTVTTDGYFRLWNGLAHVLHNEPTFPLKLAKALSPETFSPPIFACLCSANLHMALKRLAAYKPIVGPLQLDLYQDDQTITVAFSELSQTIPLPPSMVAFELVFWVQIARIATREQIRPLAVHATVELPAVEVYEDYFGTPVQMGRFNGLTFSTSDALKPFLTVSDSTWAIFEPELRRRLDDLTQESSFRDRVRACLIEILASGQSSIDDVAAQLAISSRTLQRRLQTEDTSFQKVLDELRQELARHYLVASDYSSGQIAFLLGYEEPNSFFRAFRAWTGQTPEHVRASFQ